MIRDRLTKPFRNRPDTLRLGLILLVAFALRVAVRAASGPAFFWKNSYLFYFTLAQSIAAGKGYAYPNGQPAIFRVPLYSIYLAIVTQGRQAFWPLLIAQALVSTATVACAYGIARRLFGARAGLLAAGLTALYPYYVWHDTALQETGLLTFLTAAAMLLLLGLQRSRSPVLACLTGLVMGLAILTRPVILPATLLGIGWLLIGAPARAPLGRRLASLAICLAVLTATVAPWIIRNDRVSGHPVIGTEFGAALLYGNNDRTFAFYPTRSIDLSARATREDFTPDDWRELAAFGRDDVARSAWFQRRGTAWIEAHPVAFVIGALRKNVAAFGVLPSPRHDWKTDVIAAASYGPVLLLGLVGLWRTRARWREVLPVHAQFVCFAGVTAMLWGHSSHRAYLDVYLIVFAAGVLAAWLRRKVPAS